MFIIARIVIAQDTTQHVEAMKLFSWIALVFIVIGLVKWRLQYKKEDSTSPSLSQREKAFASRLAGVGTNEQKRVSNTTVQRPKIIACPSCHAKNYSTSNYCHMCGRKLPRT